MARVQLEFTPEDFQRLEELKKELLPNRRDLILDALSAWTQQLRKSSVPFVLEYENGIVERNRSAEVENVRLRQSNKELTILVEEKDAEIRQKDQTIKVLTIALSSAQKELAKNQTPELEVEVEEISLLLAMWNATSIKPGIAGFSVDLKLLAERTRDYFEKRSLPISLGLTDSSRK